MNLQSNTTVSKEQLQSWRWKYNITPKLWFLSAGLHGVFTHKTNIDFITSVKTSKHLEYIFIPHCNPNSTHFGCEKLFVVNICDFNILIVIGLSIKRRKMWRHSLAKEFNVPINCRFRFAASEMFLVYQADLHIRNVWKVLWFECHGQTCSITGWQWLLIALFSELTWFW